MNVSKKSTVKVFRMVVVFGVEMGGGWKSYRSKHIDTNFTDYTDFHNHY